MLGLIIILGFFPTTPVRGIVVTGKVFTDTLCLCLENLGRNTGKSVVSGLSYIKINVFRLRFMCFGLIRTLCSQVNFTIPAVFQV